MDSRPSAAQNPDTLSSRVLQRPAEHEGLPADFIPLRLVLQPSGATMEVVQTDVLVGRHSSADVRLPLPDVSRRHCRLLFTDGCWQVIDLGSLNGVYLNSHLVRQSPLATGDCLQIGGFTFQVEIPGCRPADLCEGLILNLFRKPQGSSSGQQRAS